MQCPICREVVKPGHFCAKCGKRMLDLSIEVDQNALYQKDSTGEMRLILRNHLDLPLENVTLAVRSPGFGFSYLGGGFQDREVRADLEDMAPHEAREVCVDVDAKKRSLKTNIYLTLAYTSGGRTKRMVFRHAAVVLPVLDDISSTVEINTVVRNMQEVFGQDNSPHIHVDQPADQQREILIDFYRQCRESEPEWVSAPVVSVEEMDACRRLSFGDPGHAADRLWLRCPDAGRDVLLVARTAVVLGRREDSDIVLRIYPDKGDSRNGDDPPDPSLSLLISRRHAAIEVRDDRLFIRDLGSTNGTTVAGAGVRPDSIREIRDGDEIGIGWKRFFRYGKGWTFRELVPKTVDLHRIADSGRDEGTGERVLPVMRLRTGVYAACEIPFDPREGDLLTEPECPVDAVRLERVNNRTGESYVVLLKSAGIGGGPEDAVFLPDLAPGSARLWYCRGGFWIAAQAGGAAVEKNGKILSGEQLHALAPGDRLKIDKQTVWVRDGRPGGTNGQA